MRKALAVLLCLLMASPAYSFVGSGGIWIARAHDFTATNESGDATGLSIADAYMSTTGFGQLWPGTENLTLPGYRPGICWLWARYDAYRVVGTPFESWPRGVRQMRVDSLGVRADSSLTTPRLGPSSGYNYGGAIRVVDGKTFPLTVAGVQTALNELSTVGGGECWVPENANILLGTVPVKIPNFCKLKGQTSYSGGGYTFTSNASTNVIAAVMNADTSGSQQYCAVEGVNIWGGATGARIDAGIKIKKVFVGSYVRDCLVTNVTGVGYRIEGDNTTSAGQLALDYDAATNTGSYGFLLNSSLRSIWMEKCTGERPGRNTAAVLVNGATTTSGANIGVGISHFYTEITDSMSSGIIVDGASNVNISNYTASVPSGRMRSAVRVQNTNNAVNTFSPSGVTVDGLYAASDTLVEDIVFGRAITSGYDVNNPYAFLIHWNAADVAGSVPANGLQNSGQIVGVQPARFAPTLTSAATLTPVPNGGNYFTVLSGPGSTDVLFNDSFIGKMVTFRFTGIDTVYAVNHWKMDGDFISDGSGIEDDLTGFVDNAKNFKETSRSFH
jgi:hypothetical protein